MNSVIFANKFLILYKLFFFCFTVIKFTFDVKKVELSSFPLSQIILLL